MRGEKKKLKTQIFASSPGGEKFWPPLTGRKTRGPP